MAGRCGGRLHQRRVCGHLPNRSVRSGAIRNGNGTFTDVKASGTADTGGWASATFVDYDRDGWLDLFVGNY
jgi:hypothetical protein